MLNHFEHGLFLMFPQACSNCCIANERRGEIGDTLVPGTQFSGSHPVGKESLEPGECLEVISIACGR